jgi:hypothetical protein
MRKNNSFIGKEASVTTIKASGISSNINKFNYTKGGVWPYTLLNNVPPLVEYLVVGGGGGTGYYASGGGGAGGFRTGFYQITPATRTNSFNVIVGAGGGESVGTLVGFNGRDSRFASIHSVGGGGGWGYTSMIVSLPVRAFVDHGGTGGSGGGGMPNGPGAVFTAMNGGSGIAGQGYDGGKSGFSSTSVYPFRGGGGGGGGAGGKGGDYIEPSSGGPYLPAGGLCATSAITGVLTEYAGGGGGGGYPGYTGYNIVASAGAGAGTGSSTTYSAINQNASIPNRGSGGGGSGSGGGGSGSSGVVILAYPTAFAAITTITNLTYSVSTTSRPGYYVYTFTAHSGSGGTIAWS